MVYLVRPKMSLYTPTVCYNVLNKKIEPDMGVAVARHQKGPSKVLSRVLV